MAAALWAAAWRRPARAGGAAARQPLRAAAAAGGQQQVAELAVGLVSVLLLEHVGESNGQLLRTAVQPVRGLGGRLQAQRALLHAAARVQPRACMASGSRRRGSTARLQLGQRGQRGHGKGGGDLAPARRPLFVGDPQAQARQLAAQVRRRRYLGPGLRSRRSSGQAQSLMPAAAGRRRRSPQPPPACQPALQAAPQRRSPAGSPAAWASPASAARAGRPPARRRAPTRTRA